MSEPNARLICVLSKRVFLLCAETIKVDTGCEFIGWEFSFRKELTHKAAIKTIINSQKTCDNLIYLRHEISFEIRPVNETGNEDRFSR
jgi:hypothetical protein